MKIFLLSVEICAFDFTHFFCYNLLIKEKTPKREEKRQKNV